MFGVRTGATEISHQTTHGMLTYLSRWNREVGGFRGFTKVFRVFNNKNSGVVRGNRGRWHNVGEVGGPRVEIKFRYQGKGVPGPTIVNSNVRNRIRFGVVREPVEEGVVGGSRAEIKI